MRPRNARLLFPDRPTLRVLAAAFAGGGAACGDEKKQLFHRLPPEFVRRILSEFNAGNLDAASPKTRLYELRSAWLGGRDAFRSKASDGAHRGIWPDDVLAFLEQLVPLARPPNFQLVADELKRLFGFVRARSSVEAFLTTHLPHLLPDPPPRIRTYRRFRRAHIGELWQHDSSIHQWWPAAQKQILLLTVANPARLGNMRVTEKGVMLPDEFQVVHPAGVEPINLHCWNLASDSLLTKR